MIDPRAWRMPEAELMEEIRRMCTSLRLLAFHVRDSRGSWGAGFPDLCIASRRGVIFAELKSMTGTLTADQRRWRDALTAAGVTYRLWTPADYFAGVIAGELVKLSPLPVAGIA